MYATRLHRICRDLYYNIFPPCTCDHEYTQSLRWKSEPSLGRIRFSSTRWSGPRARVWLCQSGYRSSQAVFDNESDRTRHCRALICTTLIRLFNAVFVFDTHVYTARPHLASCRLSRADCSLLFFLPSASAVLHILRCSPEDQRCCAVLISEGRFRCRKICDRVPRPINGSFSGNFPPESRGARWDTSDKWKRACIPYRSIRRVALLPQIQFASRYFPRSLIASSAARRELSQQI